MAEPASAVRNVVEALVVWARDERGRMGDRAADGVSSALRELGFVTQAEHEELELRVAQLEHRLRLVESAESTRAVSAGAVHDASAAPTAE